MEGAIGARYGSHLNAGVGAINPTQQWIGSKAIYGTKAKARIEKTMIRCREIDKAKLLVQPQPDPFQ